MTTFTGFPRNDHSFSAFEVGEALAGLIIRDEDGLPLEGIIREPRVTAVAAAWRVKVWPFTHVARVGNGVRFSGVSAAEEIEITSSAGIPAGQARIDVVCWDAEAFELVVIPGVVSASPSPPDVENLVSLADVRVNAGDGSVVASRIELGFFQTFLAVEDTQVVVKGTVSARSVAAGGTTKVNVSFGGAFEGAPNVQATPLGDVRDVTVSVMNVTKNGCTIVLGSNSIVRRSFGAMWRAE